MIRHALMYTKRPLQNFASTAFPANRRNASSAARHNSTPHSRALLVPAKVAPAQRAPSRGSLPTSTQTYAPIPHDIQLRTGTRPGETTNPRETTVTSHTGDEAHFSQHVVNVRGETCHTHTLDLRSERCCRIVSHMSARALTVCSQGMILIYASRFVRVVHSSHMVSIKLGTETPSVVVDCKYTVLAVLPARAPAVPCLASVTFPACEGLSSP